MVMHLVLSELWASSTPSDQAEIGCTRAPLFASHPWQLTEDARGELSEKKPGYISEPADTRYELEKL